MGPHSIAARLRRLATEKPTDICAELLHLAADLEPEYYQPRNPPVPESVAQQFPPVPEPVETVPEEDAPALRPRGLLDIFRRTS